MTVAALVLGVLVGTHVVIFAGDLVDLLRARRMAARLAEVVTEERTHPADDLTALAVTVDVDPRPTYGQERLYDAADLVQVGLAMVHRGCRDARRDAATDHVCPACGRLLAQSATEAQR